MLVFLPLFLMMRGGSAQGPPPSGGGAGNVEFGLILTSPIYVCSDKLSQAFVDTSKAEVVRFNESISFITGFLEFNGIVAENTMMEIVLAKEASGKLETVLTLEICNVCDEKLNPDSNYKDLFEQIGLPEKCPFGPGAYPIYDMIVDTSELPINSANVGNYMATINYYTADGDCQGEKTFVACMKINCCIEPL